MPTFRTVMTFAALTKILMMPLPNTTDALDISLGHIIQFTLLLLINLINLFNHVIILLLEIIIAEISHAIIGPPVLTPTISWQQV